MSKRIKLEEVEVSLQCGINWRLILMSRMMRVETLPDLYAIMMGIAKNQTSAYAVLLDDGRIRICEEMNTSETLIMFVPAGHWRWVKTLCN